MNKGRRDLAGGESRGYDTGKSGRSMGVGQQLRVVSNTSEATKRAPLTCVLIGQTISKDTRSTRRGGPRWPLDGNRTLGLDRSRIKAYPSANRRAGGDVCGPTWCGARRGGWINRAGLIFCPLLAILAHSAERESSRKTQNRTSVAPLLDRFC